MLEISTYTRPFLSCQIWAVPIGAPLMLYMMAFAAETEFCIRWADEQAPQSTTTAAMLNSRDPLGTFIFRLRIEGFAGAAVSGRRSWMSASPANGTTMRKFPSFRPD